MNPYCERKKERKKKRKEGRRKEGREGGRNAGRKERSPSRQISMIQCRKKEENRNAPLEHHN